MCNSSCSRRPSEPPASVAFLAPLDPLVWDRDFLRALFDFDYVWEVYVPERKRALRPGPLPPPPDHRAV